MLDDNRIYQCQHCNVWVYDPDLKRKTCDICGASYCSSCFKKDEKYVMLDGQTACQNCCENATSVKNIAKSSVRSLKGYSVAWCTDVYAKDEIRQGSLFVKVTANLTPVPYSNGGNVAQCAHCGKWIYYDGKGVKNCATCNEFIGEKCYSEIRKSDSSGHKPYKLLNADQYYCNRCKTGVPLAGGRTLYEGIRMPNTQRTGAVLDNAVDRMVDSIVHCAGCNQKIFYNRLAVAEYTSCELCGRILERTCASKLKNDSFLGKKICPLCEADKRKMKGYRSYASELEEAKKAVEAAVEERTAIERQNEDLRKRWEQVVWNTIERYAPYFKLSHRISVLRAKRKGKTNAGVLKVIVETFDFEKNKVLRFPSLALNETVLPKEIGTDGKKNSTKQAQVREYVSFRIIIKNTAYSFVYRNGKITFWGVD